MTPERPTVAPEEIVDALVSSLGKPVVLTAGGLLIEVIVTSVSDVLMDAGLMGAPQAEIHVTGNAWTVEGEEE